MYIYSSSTPPYIIEGTEATAVVIDLDNGQRGLLN